MAPSLTWPSKFNKRLEAFLLAHSKLAKYCTLLKLPNEVQYRAEGIYEQAYDANLKRKDSLRAFLTACLFLACRQKEIYMPRYLASMVGDLDAPVAKTIEALWHLENFFDKETDVGHDEITVTCEPSNSPFDLHLLELGVHLSWSAGSGAAVVMADLKSDSPSLRQLRAHHTALSEQAQQETELSEEISTVEENSYEEFEQYEVIAMDDEKDWEVIDREDEPKANINSNDKAEKTAKAKGWVGTVRRGLFG